MLTNLFFFRRRLALILAVFQFSLVTFQNYLTNQNLFQTVVVSIPYFLLADVSPYLTGVAVGVTGKRLVLQFLNSNGNRRNLPIST
jgi:hypothetical protein